MAASWKFWIYAKLNKQLLVGALSTLYRLLSGVPTVFVKALTDSWRPDGVRTGIGKAPDDYRVNNDQNLAGTGQFVQVRYNNTFRDYFVWLNLFINDPMRRRMRRMVPIPPKVLRVALWTIGSCSYHVWLLQYFGDHRRQVVTRKRTQAQKVTGAHLAVEATLEKG